MTGVRYSSFFFSDVLARTRRKLGGWMELGPPLFVGVFFGELL